MTITTRIIEIVAQTLAENHPWRAEPVVTAASNLDDLKADCLDKMSIANRVEIEFGIEISDRAVTDWASVSDIIALVERRTQGIAA